MKNIAETHTSNFVSNDDYNHVRGVPLLALFANRMVSQEYLVGALFRESILETLLSIENQKKSLKRIIDADAASINYFGIASVFCLLLSLFCLYALHINLFGAAGSVTNELVARITVGCFVSWAISMLFYLVTVANRKTLQIKYQSLLKSWPDTDRLRAFDWACELLGAHLANHLVLVIPEPHRLELTWAERARGLQQAGVLYLSSLGREDQLCTIRRGLVALAYTVISQDKRCPSNPDIDARNAFSEIMDILNELVLIPKVFPEGHNTVDSGWKAVFEEADALYKARHSQVSLGATA
jgi:hypothetical protein